MIEYLNIDFVKSRTYQETGGKDKILSFVSDNCYKMVELREIEKGAWGVCFDERAHRYLDRYIYKAVRKPGPRTLPYGVPIIKTAPKGLGILATGQKDDRKMRPILTWIAENWDVTVTDEYNTHFKPDFSRYPRMTLSG